MGFSKKHWLVHFLMLVAIVYLAPANCRQERTFNEPKNTGEKVCKLPHNAPDCPLADTDDEDEAGVKSGQNNEVGSESVPDAGQNGVYAECDTECECDHRCGIRCINHLCVQFLCCGDDDCQDGKVCNLGNCTTPQCASNADCGCDEYCFHHFCRNDSESFNRNSCCGTDFNYQGTCISHEYIENGHCLESSHCPAGEYCSDRLCLPVNCTNNADCGCEAVCRKGRCESGCDNNSGCCIEGHICDRGECIDPNEEEDEDEEDE